MGSHLQPRSEDDGSRNDHRNALIVQDGYGGGPFVLARGVLLFVSVVGMFVLCVGNMFRPLSCCTARSGNKRDTANFALVGYRRYPNANSRCDRTSYV